MSMIITAIDAQSVHRINAGQVVVDLQSAVKELVENSLDAGATAIDVKFVNHGLSSLDVVDNGSGIAQDDHDTIALKHYTSKLATFDDLARVLTFGFRGEALSSLCALADGLTVTTATASDAPMGSVIEMDRNGEVRSKHRIARQRGTTVQVPNLFKPLPVRRKEFERNAKREFQKALNLLHAYALVPCAMENKPVRFTVTNQTDGGRKHVQFKTDGSPSIRASVLALWGPRALENVVDLDLAFDVDTEKSVNRRVDPDKDISLVTPVKVRGLISRFTVGAGRTTPDRQFFFLNGRPYNPGKVQKAINEVYRSFNANQSPFVIANVILPTNACDINVSPDKRTIFLHSENNLVQALKTALETEYSSARSTFDVSTQQTPQSVSDKPRAERIRDQPTLPEEPRTFGVPRLLLEDDGTSEPEPTLVAQPDGRRSGEKNGGRSRNPSEPLFIPDSDEESVQVGERTREDPLPLQTARSATTSVAASSDRARSSVGIAEKPRSVQTVLNTRGAAWNVQGDAGAGGERKRPRLSNEGDRATKRRSFRSSLSQFLGSGSKVMPDEGSDESESDESLRGNDPNTEEVDRVDKRPSKVGTARPRAGSDSSQVTMIVLSDDENRMDVDGPSATIKPLRATASTVPQTDAGDVPDREEDAEDASEDDSALSSTLVGTYVPPPGALEKSVDSVTLRVNLVDIGTYYLDMYHRLSSPPSSSPALPSSTLRSAVSCANLETAAEDSVAAAALSRIVSKADFERMAVVGQFNLGFIVVRKRNDGSRNGGLDDLFIVDQHAADEKWNFETLQETTVIASQRLFRPQQLQFTAADEMLALENMDVLKRNGFELERVEETDGEGVRMRLRLIAQPMSKDTVFDVKDLEELIHLMQDRPRGSMVRCSKARAMFAMRACRRSVMIGKALDKTRMTTIVRHMGTMDQPWNCPHGRPTMRHLSDLTSFGRYAPPRRMVDWETWRA